MLAGFECIAFADGVGRRPLPKQANPRENPQPLKTKGAAPANPREGEPKKRQTQEKSLTPRGELQENAGTLKKNSGDSFGGKSGC
jgi:hypothetical protein